MRNILIKYILQFQDYILFLLVLFAGIFTKIYLEIQKGKKATVSWFLAEAIVSFFVAFSVYAICDQYLSLNKIFTYVLCAWGGSMSTLIHAEVEELISSFFDSLQNLIKNKMS